MDHTMLAAILLSPEQTAEITNIVITIVIGVFGTVAITLVGTIRSYVKAKFGEQALETLDKAANSAVQAAESYLGSGAGQEKKALALQLLSDTLAKYGVNLTPEQLDAAIEAAVNKNFNIGKAVSPEPSETVVSLPPDEG